PFHISSLSRFLCQNGTSQVAGVITSALTALPFEFDETTQAYFRRAGVSQSAQMSSFYYTVIYAFDI
ncbi:hypothetical protein, partial [Anaerotruncus colihominis]|uniref:hypothetical protein n=1 Tax=Anaerotruncus colihominis TaxID=169435 RepID=UPI003AB62C0E